MSKTNSFLSAEEEQEIVLAIRQAEKNTSGEIRVHIEASSSIPHRQRALQVFNGLKMFNTQQKNAVLFYLAVKDQKFVIYGDEGIDRVVSENFWDSTKSLMQEQFKIGNFKQGIVSGIIKAGEELKVHFPWQLDDKDELPNQISKA
ncbi:MAG: TPM domain-containing protein [Tenacibaculum sp.]